jgi:hypothetical protein
MRPWAHGSGTTFISSIVKGLSGPSTGTAWARECAVRSTMAEGLEKLRALQEVQLVEMVISSDAIRRYDWKTGSYMLRQPSLRMRLIVFLFAESGGRRIGETRGDEGRDCSFSDHQPDKLCTTSVRSSEA